VGRCSKWHLFRLKGFSVLRRYCIELNTTGHVALGRGRGPHTPAGGVCMCVSVRAVWFDQQRYSKRRRRRQRASLPSGLVSSHLLPSRLMVRSVCLRAFLDRSISNCVAGAQLKRGREEANEVRVRALFLFRCWWCVCGSRGRKISSGDVLTGW
jgi:hypothetical protein